MAVTQEMVAFGIRALIRLGHAGREAYEQKVTGTPQALPDIVTIRAGWCDRAQLVVSDALDGSTLPAVLDAAEVDQIRRRYLEAPDGPERAQAGAELLDVACIAQPEFAARVHGEERTEALHFLQQWSPEHHRTSPVERVGIALADVVLEYVATDPGVLRIGGNGERLVQAVATNLRGLLPDPDNPAAPGNDFAEGAITIFVQAGLGALRGNVDAMLGEAHLQELTRAVLDPVIGHFQDAESGAQKWYEIKDTLLGPVAESAIGVVLEHRDAFLGREAGGDSPLGAVTESVLLAVKDQGLADDLGTDGVLRVYRAALAVAVERPGLFTGLTGEGARAVVGNQVLARLASHLRQAPPPFDRALAAEVVVLALESVSGHAALVFDAQGDWGEVSNRVMAVLVEEITGGLQDGLRRQDAAPGGPAVYSAVMERLFTREQARRLLSHVAGRVAATPGMVAADGAPELRALVAVIARTMRDQETVLISAEGWLRIAATMTEEVSRNPNRLLDLDHLDAPERQLAYRIVRTLLEAAAEDFNEAADTTGGVHAGRRRGSLVFGDNLADAAVDALRIAAGNAVQASEHLAALQALVSRLNTLVRNQPGRVGRKEWALLFRQMAADVLETGALPDLADAALMELLFLPDGTGTTTGGNG